MKKSIKTVTLTIDELDQIIRHSHSGDVFAAKELINTKIQEKRERLRQQRELRRQRKEQKMLEAKESKKSMVDECAGYTDIADKSVTLPLNKALADCILWINNRRDALKSNIIRFVNEIRRVAGRSSSIADIESALMLLIRLAEQTAPAAFNHLHAKHRLRPTSLTIRL